MILRFVAVLIPVFVVFVSLDLFNQFARQKKTVSEIKAGFNWTVLRMFLIFVVFTTSTFLWHYMGWKSGQPIHLP
jgi:hypothetical protein